MIKTAHAMERGVRPPDAFAGGVRAGRTRGAVLVLALAALAAGCAMPPEDVSEDSLKLYEEAVASIGCDLITERVEIDLVVLGKNPQDALERARAGAVRRRHEVVRERDRAVGRGAQARRGEALRGGCRGRLFGPRFEQVPCCVQYFVALKPCEGVAAGPSVSGAAA